MESPGIFRETRLNRKKRLMDLDLETVHRLLK